MPGFDRRNDLSTRRRAAFTLIELLVVIAIIAILAAILFPAFAAAREKARQIMCGSNEKQIALACISYSEDNDGRFPIGFAWPTGASVPTCWMEEIAPYLNSTGILQCSDDGLAGIPADGLNVSYTANGEIWANWGAADEFVPVGPMSVASGVWDADTAGVGSLNDSQISFPDNSILLTESWSQDWYATSPNNYGNGKIGNAMSFWAMRDVIDGNSNPMPNGQAATTSGWDSGPNGAVSAHLRTTIDNGGLANFAFCDGHVKAMSPPATFGGWNNNSMDIGGNLWDARRTTEDSTAQAY
jgi:prepilin-type N-terminal cleavage/methylation domain-containing protein/prepilin-type processing-associated H-X9-DG protein